MSVHVEENGSPNARRKSVTVVGAGGNIGSHLVPHLGRLPSVERVTLVDPDIYTDGNLRGQDITRGDVGRPKVVVQRKRLRQINNALEVDVVADRIEATPLGRLRADVIVACLDSREARQSVNQAAWRLGIPWIDAAVDGDRLLARVKVYKPDTNGPCLECAWGEVEYALVEQTYPCVDQNAAPATNAPSYLGALAASLQAVECAKLLHGKPAMSLVDCEVLIDAANHKQYRTAYSRNPHCRFDHRIWQITVLDSSPRQLTIGEALHLGRGRADEMCHILRVENDAFVLRLSCTKCGKSQSVTRLARALRSREKICANCGGVLAALGFDMESQLDARKGQFSGLERRSLASLGFRSGDVFAVMDATRESFYQLGV